MPWWWMRPPSAAQELSLGMSHWVMSHNYQWQPAIFASTRFTSTVEWPISNHIHMWLLSMLKPSKVDWRRENSYWCVIFKRGLTPPGVIIHLEASSFSIRWRDLFPYPGMVLTCGWTGLDMAGHRTKTHRNPLRRSECLHDGASWLACFHHFYPFLASIVAATISGSNLALSRGIQPEHYLTDVELFFVLVIWTRWTSLVDPSCRSTSDAMRSCPQQVVLSSLYLSMDGSSEEFKVAHAEYPFWSCRNSRRQKNVGRN